ncbi:hypothetical protein OG226_12320 [Streptomyces sp. NBC_01261]|uniref:hypothetical protein n=1 Tax=Streptomyces sp. NBC_01261 TaxID=2903802 RepID=UPI002E2F9EFC|nr:hypothetical protein [Streptomyces sp. NBC_01261]
MVLGRVLSLALVRAELLGADQVLVQSMGWPRWLPAYDTPRSLEPDGTRAVLTEVLVVLQHSECPDRWAFLAGGAAALAGVACNRLKRRHSS